MQDTWTLGNTELIVYCTYLFSHLIPGCTQVAATAICSQHVSDPDCDGLSLSRDVHAPPSRPPQQTLHPRFALHVLRLDPVAPPTRRRQERPVAGSISFISPTAAHALPVSHHHSALSSVCSTDAPCCGERSGGGTEGSAKGQENFHSHSSGIVNCSIMWLVPALYICYMK